MSLSAVQSSLHTEVQALLKEMNSRCTSQKGWIRWSLEKKVEVDPSCSVSLICVLVKELEKKLKKMHKTQSHTHVIPILHTLYYAIIQSDSMIPRSLYQRVHECLMKLLILPRPHSAVVLSTLSSVKMEMTAPGSLHQRRVIAERNLKSKNFTLQEKVFVLADPDVFTAQLEATVRTYLEVSGLFRDTPTAMKKNLMLRMMQKGLGTACRSSTLAQALEALDDQMVEKRFDEVVRAVEQSVKHGAGGSATYLNRLQHIQRDMLTAATEVTEEDCGSVCSRMLSFPEIKFILWTNEEDLWNLLANFSLSSGSKSSVDEDKRHKRDGSEDGGTKRHLKESDFGDTLQPLVQNPSIAISRRNACKKGNPGDKLRLMREKMEMLPGSCRVLRDDCRCLTARVVVMGDDRVLGRLSRVLLSIRERESKRLILTKKLNLELYYVPVVDVEPQPRSPDGRCQDEGRLSLAGLLGRVDPWYNSNINSLRATISNLARKHTNHRESESDQNLFLLDTLCYYLRCGTQPVNLPMYSVKMTRCGRDASSVVEDVFVSHLEADMPEFRHLKEKFPKEPSSGRKKSTIVVHGAVVSVSYTETSLSKRRVARGEARMTCGVVITSEPAAVTTGEDLLWVSFDSINLGDNKKIRTQNISIRTMEDQTLSVCLDRDSRRTYTDVQRIDVSPCLDPGCSLRSRFTVGNERELPLSKYLNNVLSLPINTFTGVTL